MSYQVLARKWRPRTFDELVGQRHVLQALTNALDSERLHHAYLFTGTRGVGKTTVARIFAKSLNCEQGVSSKPCGQCSSCTEIDEGRFVDLIEVDAASRTGVDDTRELLDNVQYAPTRGRYKVYLIDEVHMFSKSSFNALLKTLEEPPAHIKFLLATTDPKKIPPTILSRCLQFNLKRITVEHIEQQLRKILEQEKIETDDRSLEMIATAADGSLRDALSLLDQAIAFGGGVLRADEVAGMLGTIDKDQVLGLLQILAEKNAATMLEKLNELKELGPDYSIILSELLALLQAISVHQLVPEARKEHRDRERLEKIAAKMTPEESQLFYQIALTGLRDLSFHPDPGSGFEMILLRMLAFRKLHVEEVIDPALVKKKPSKRSDKIGLSDQEPFEQSKAAVANVSQSTSLRPGDWHDVIEQLNLDGLPYQLALGCVFEKYEDGEFHLSLSPGSMRTARIEEQLQQALRDRFGSDLRLVISEKVLEGTETPRARQSREEQQRLDEARQVIESDPDVQALCDAFDATIIQDSIRPLKGGK